MAAGKKQAEKELFAQYGIEYGPLNLHQSATERRKPGEPGTDRANDDEKPRIYQRACGDLEIESKHPGLLYPKKITTSEVS
jgi:hypothetical protein